MKKHLLLLIIICSALIVNAQHSGKNERDRIVIDSAGMQYPYAVWKKMVETKAYKLKKINRNSDTSAYLIVKLDSAQVERRLGQMEKPDESKFFKEGEKIKFFNATDINGYKLKKKDLEGKIIVLNFWFKGCSPCRKEFPELDKVCLKYANDPGVVFIAVSLDDVEDIVPFLKDHPLSYHIVSNGRPYSNFYEVKLYPTNVVIDKDGVVRFSSSGYKVNTAYWIGKTIEEAKAGS